MAKEEKANTEHARKKLRNIPDFLQEKDRRIHGYDTIVEVHTPIVKTDFGTERAYAWVVNEEKIIQDLGKDMRPTKVETLKDYKDLSAYFKQAEPGSYPLGKVTVQGASKTAIPNICDTLYPAYTPPIVNAVLYDILAGKIRLRNSELTGWLRSADRKGTYFTRPPLTCLTLR